MSERCAWNALKYNKVSANQIRNIPTSRTNNIHTTHQNQTRKHGGKGGKRQHKRRKRSPRNDARTTATTRTITWHDTNASKNSWRPPNSSTSSSGQLPARRTAYTSTTLPKIHLCAAKPTGPRPPASGPRQTTDRATNIQAALRGPFRHCLLRSQPRPVTVAWGSPRGAGCHTPRSATADRASCSPWYVPQSTTPDATENATRRPRGLPTTPGKPKPTGHDAAAHWTMRCLRGHQTPKPTRDGNIRIRRWGANPTPPESTDEKCDSQRGQRKGFKKDEKPQATAAHTWQRNPEENRQTDRQTQSHRN
jgi:hypothetical protein